MQNVHKHESSLYPKCTHPDIISRDSPKWLQPGKYTKSTGIQLWGKSYIYGYILYDFINGAIIEFSLKVHMYWTK